MKNLCMVFQVHQPFRLRNFPFTRIGSGGMYFDEEVNAAVIRNLAEQCYLPNNRLLLKLVQSQQGKFRAAFSISGTALDQFEKYMPEVTESFKALADTGSVEFLAETYAHTVPELRMGRGFREQVLAHAQKTELLFGMRPRVFRHSAAAFTDGMADVLPGLGFEAILHCGNYDFPQTRDDFLIYHSITRPAFKLLFNHTRMARDISFGFSGRQSPPNAKAFVNRLQDIPGQAPHVNICLDYETFGIYHHLSSGIIDFLKKLPGEANRSGDICFMTPSEAIASPAAKCSVAWRPKDPPDDKPLHHSPLLQNDLQRDAFHHLSALEHKIGVCSDAAFRKDWFYLQSSDHFYYMGMQYPGPGGAQCGFSPYKDPFDAYVNYMNVLTDFTLRLDNWLESNKTRIHEQYTVKAGLHI